MRILAAILAMAALMSAARAEDLPDQRPMLRIEPGMHTARIWRIGVNAACALMVTGSEDKTARLWALPSGGRGAPELLRTLHVPIGEGHDGKLYAVALSPDGKWVAAGGWDANAQERKENGVYIFEAATGKIATRLGRIGDSIKHLVFSPDGSRLAAALAGGEGIRMWETTGWRLLAEDRNYGGSSSYGAAFDGMNRLYSVAFDGQIRRYGADGRLEAKARSQGGREPASVALHPNGGKLAIGFNESTLVNIYDARTLKRIYPADINGILGGSLSSVSWSTDGARLYAGGQHQSADWRVPIFIWQEEAQGARSEIPLSLSTISQLLPCGGGIAAGDSGPAFGLIAQNGEKLVWQESVIPDMRNKRRNALTLSIDSKRVRFGLGVADRQPVLFDLDTFNLSDSTDIPAGLTEPRTAGITVKDWEGNTAPKLNGKPIALEPSEFSRSLAITPDLQRFALGTEWSLHAYRADGFQLWQKATDTAFGVNISGNGKLLVAALGDGTIRWHRLSDGKELLALFVHAKDKRFVAWTPKGYYAASPGAEDLIGWHVNRDWDHAPDFYPASRFRDQFNRPDIVKRVLDDLDEDAAIAEANRLAGARQAEDIAKKLPPVVTILSPNEGGAFASDALTLEYALRSPSGLAVTEVAALVDGRPLPGATTSGAMPLDLRSEATARMTLTGLPQRDLTLSLVARAGGLDSPPASVRLKFKGAPEKPAQDAARASAPTVSLYALVVGVGKFKDAKINPLTWAGEDAREFARALQRQQGRLYRKVDVKLLVEEEADNASIIDGLTWLGRQVSQGDVGVVFLAGHGVTDPRGNYSYVPYNARLEDVAGVSLPTRASSVPASEIRQALRDLAGNALFFFDTCHAGGAAGISFRGAPDTNKLINEIAESANAIVLASSTSGELSQERDDWRHGAFTKALLEGLAGAADAMPKDGVITIDELNLYVKERVKELTGGLQHPVDLKPKEARNIAFAMP
jgi:WD40 repeat protein